VEGEGWRVKTGRGEEEKRGRGEEGRKVRRLFKISPQIHTGTDVRRLSNAA
jgi:hypothetical protein